MLKKILGLTFASSYHGNTTRLAPNAEDDWFLYPGNEEMSAFPRYQWKNSTESIEYHSPLTTIT